MKIYTRIGERTWVDPEEITHLEADINYTRVHLRNGSTQTISYTLKKVHECLSQEKFLRVSKSFVINIEQVSMFKSSSIWLKNGKEFITSRRRTRDIQQQLCAFA